MRNRILWSVAVVAIAAIAIACPKGPVEPPPDQARPVKLEKIVIGRVPSGNVVDITEKMEPLLALMKERLGIEAELSFAMDYSKFTERMKTNDFDLAFCAPFQYIEAHEQAGYEAVLRPVRDGADTYSGVIITARPEITSVAQLRGKKIAFSDKKSTSGYLFPLGLLISSGLKLTDFQSAFVDGHDNVVLNVLSKSYDAGACFDGAQKIYGKTRAHLLKTIARTDPIYNEPIAIGPKFRTERAELAARILDFFKTLHETPEGQRAIEKYGDRVQRFVDAGDSDYDTVRRYAEALPAEVIQASGQ